jgi:hypothetical protein
MKEHNWDGITHWGEEKCQECGIIRKIRFSDSLSTPYFTYRLLKDTHIEYVDDCEKMQNLLDIKYIIE